MLEELEILCSSKVMSVNHVQFETLEVHIRDPYTYSETLSHLIQVCCLSLILDSMAGVQWDLLVAQ